MNTLLTLLFRIAAYLAFAAGMFWLIMYCILGRNRIWLELWQIACLIVIPFLILVFLQPTKGSRSRSVRTETDTITSRLTHTAKQTSAIILGVFLLVAVWLLGGFFVWKAMNSPEGSGHRSQLLLP